MTKIGEKIKKFLDSGRDKDKKSKKNADKSTSRISELDDSRHAMEKLDRKKARAKGEEAPTFKPRAEIPKSKK